MDSASLPLAWYTGPDAFSHERRTLFAHEWQMIGRADQLAAPGAYVCANLAGWSVFAMRDATGALGGFRNACRHQSLPVLDNGAGTAKRLLRRLRQRAADGRAARPQIRRPSSALHRRR